MGFAAIYFILFAVFCGFGFFYLFKPVSFVKHPFNKEVYFPMTGAQQCLMFILLTGLLRFGYEGFSMDLSAIKLLYLIALLITGIMVLPGKIDRSPVLIIYSIFLLWLLYSLSFSPVKGYGVRTFLKYLFPILALIFAMKCRVNELTLIKYLDALIKISILFLFLYLFWFVDKFQFLFCTYATFADYLAVMSVVSLGLFYLTRKKKYIYYIPLFLTFSLKSSIRTGILATFVGIAVFFIIKYKLKSLPIVLVGMGILASIFLYVPSFREKMFFEEKTAEHIFENAENLSVDNINTSARMAMWEWSLEHFYEPNKLVGAGLGNLQYVFYETNHPFRPLPAVHNDYIQILCDTGIIGFILYVLLLIIMVWHAMIIYHDKRSSEVLKLSAIISGASLASIMTSSITNNTVNFTAVSYLFPFVFYGITIYLLNQSKCAAKI